MRKFIIFILFFLGTFLAISGDARAIFYNGSSTQTAPSFTYSGVNFVGVEEARSPCSQYSSYYFAYMCSPYGSNSAFYYTGDTMHHFVQAISDDIIELDFSGYTFTGSYMIDTTVSDTFKSYTVLYITGSQVVFKAFNWNSSSSIVELKYSKIYNVSELVNNNLNNGGIRNKTLIIHTQNLYNSFYGPIFPDTHLFISSIQFIGNTSRTDIIYFSGITSDPKGIILTDEFSHLDTNFLYTTPFNFFNSSGQNKLYPNSPGDLPTNWFQNGVWYNIGVNGADNMNRIHLIDSEGNTAFVDNKIANFYGFSGNTVYSESGGGGSGSLSPSYNDYISECTSFIDVGCYIKGSFNFVIDTLKYYLLPNINFSGYSRSCSGDTIGSSTTGFSYIQNLNELFGVMLPTPPPEGTLVCTIFGDEFNVHYQSMIGSGSLNFFTHYHIEGLPEKFYTDGKVPGTDFTILDIVIFISVILIFI